MQNTCEDNHSELVFKVWAKSLGWVRRSLIILLITTYWT